MQLKEEVESRAVVSVVCGGRIVVPVRKTLVIQSKPLRSNIDVWCELIQWPPVDVRLK